MLPKAIFFPTQLVINIFTQILENTSEQKSNKFTKTNSTKDLQKEEQTLNVKNSVNN